MSGISVDKVPIYNQSTFSCVPVKSLLTSVEIEDWAILVKLKEWLDKALVSASDSWIGGRQCYLGVTLLFAVWWENLSFHISSLKLTRCNWSFLQTVERGCSAFSAVGGQFNSQQIHFKLSKKLHSHFLLTFLTLTFSSQSFKFVLQTHPDKTEKREVCQNKTIWWIVFREPIRALI